MVFLSDILKFNNDSSKEVLNFISNCQSEDDLVEKLRKQSSFLLPIIQNLIISEKSNSLAARLLYMVNPKDLADQNVIERVKRVETVLRNHKMLDFGRDPNISLKNLADNRNLVSAHKSILCLESLYFKRMRPYKEFNQAVMYVDTTFISGEVYQKVVEYLYMSDEDRKNFISTVDKRLLTEILQLAFHWELDELRQMCDDELSNHLIEFNIEAENLSRLLELAEYHFAPKLALLLNFVKRAADGDVYTILEQMNSPGQATQLTQLCTPEERKVFATLETAFGKLCRLPPGTFGKEHWEKHFGTIKDEHVPPFPKGIFETLELPDPVDSTKKVRDTHTLFLRPLEVNGKKVTINSIQKFAQSPKKGYRTKCQTCSILNKMVDTPLPESRWVLLRNDVIPETRNKSYGEQKTLVEKMNYKVPRTLDAILLNIVTYVSSKKRLYGDDPLTYTRCQEQFKGCQMIVGAFAPAGLSVDEDDDLYDDDFFGVAGSWKF